MSTEWCLKYCLIFRKNINFWFLLAACSFKAIAQPFPIDTIQWSGPVEKRINLVFLSDAYQFSELDQFVLDAEKVSAHFFRQTPFKQYQSYFNILAIRIPSNQSGAKKSPSEVRDTYFGSSYNFAGIERLLVASNLLGAQEILIDQVPLFDQAILIVNDPKYGGSGGWLATTSVHPAASEIALHEIGHSFAGLADEYWAGEQFAGEKPNMTKEINPDLIRWKNWLNTEDVWIYPHQENTQWVRPHQNCKMRVLDPDFCAVCREAIVKRIHDLSTPIVSQQPDSADVTLFGDTLSLRVNFLEPSPNTLRAQWTIDGVAIDGYDEIKLEKSLGPGLHMCEVTVVDTTLYVRDDVHTDTHSYKIAWRLNVEEATAIDDLMSTSTLKFFPNPVQDELIVEINPFAPKQNHNVEVIDQNGQTIQTTTLSLGRQNIPVTSLRSGMYWLRISNLQGSFSTPFIKF